MYLILCAQIKRGDNISHVFVESRTAAHVLLRIRLLDSIALCLEFAGQTFRISFGVVAMGPQGRDVNMWKCRVFAFEQSDQWNRQHTEGR